MAKNIRVKNNYNPNDDITYISELVEEGKRRTLTEDEISSIYEAAYLLRSQGIVDNNGFYNLGRCFRIQPTSEYDCLYCRLVVTKPDVLGSFSDVSIYSKYGEWLLKAKEGERFKLGEEEISLVEILEDPELQISSIINKTPIDYNDKNCLERNIRILRSMGSESPYVNIGKFFALQSDDDLIEVKLVFGINDFKKSEISISSPIGKALLNSSVKEGSSVSCFAEGETHTYIIISIADTFENLKKQVKSKHKSLGSCTSNSPKQS